MKKYTYFISFFVMVVVFAGISIFFYFKVSGSKYEEILKREAYGLPDSRSISLAIRVKPNLSKDDLENILQYAYAKELVDQVRKKQILKKILVWAYVSASDYKNHPKTTWIACLEKIGDEEDQFYFPEEGKNVHPK